jgi:predicted secreted hydrolase
MMIQEHMPVRFPADWPGDGAIDLARHDLPHASSTTEWWYFNSHLVAPGGRAFSIFAAFFRAVSKVYRDGRVELGHSLTWGLTDVERHEYLARSYVDSRAPRIGLERIKEGRGAKDPRLNRAMAEALESDRVPLPDRMFPGEVTVALESLRLDFGHCRLEKLEEGRYRLFASADGPRGPVEAELIFVAKKGAVRHGDNGLVRGVHGEDMFYYFIPRCEVAGHLCLEGSRLPLSGSGWYDHEFGRPPPGREVHGARSGNDFDTVAWNWLSVQLDNGTDVSLYELIRTDTKMTIGRCAVLVDAKGKRSAFSDFTLVPSREWTSMRTFERYPTRLALSIPAARLLLELRATVDDQEIVTAISKPAFCCRASACAAAATSNAAASVRSRGSTTSSNASVRPCAPRSARSPRSISTESTR